MKYLQQMVDDGFNNTYRFEIISVDRYIYEHGHVLLQFENVPDHERIERVKKSLKEEHKRYVNTGWKVTISVSHLIHLFDIKLTSACSVLLQY